MKKLLFLCMLLLSSCVPAPAQCISQCGVQYPNAISLAFQPADLGLGVRGDYTLSGVGVYSSLTYGDLGIYRAYDIRHHVKLTTGVRIPMRDYMHAKFNFTTGINYHILGTARINNHLVDPKIFNPWSFELGLSVYLHKVMVAVRTDILRWEPCVDIGIPIKR